jgi:hypothetical protein
MQAPGLRHLVASKEEKERKANVSTAKYSASKDLHYLCIIFKGRAVYVDWATEMPE